MRLSSEVIAGMQHLAQEQRRLLGPRAQWHVGDIAWGTRQHEGRESEWRIRLWVEDGRVVAWSWLKQDRKLLEHDVHPEHLELLDEILAESEARIAFAFEDDDRQRSALARHGYVVPGEAMHYLVRDITDPPARPPPLPPGFRCRTVDANDLSERVSIHREVWAPSRVTESSYAEVRNQWPYRDSLDCVIEGPGGRFAAYCHCWPDDLNRVGEFEPVGVRPEFRRRGLGAAVCTFALQRLYEEGGRRAIVYCVSKPACSLYESIGFRIHASLIGYSRKPTWSR